MNRMHTLNYIVWGSCSISWSAASSHCQATRICVVLKQSEHCRMILGDSNPEMPSIPNIMRCCPIMYYPFGSHPLFPSFQTLQFIDFFHDQLQGVSTAESFPGTFLQHRDRRHGDRWIWKPLKHIATTYHGWGWSYPLDLMFAEIARN